MDTLSSAVITGGLIEASRFIEYIYQFIHSIGRNGLLLPNELCTHTFPDNSGRIIAYNPTQIILDAGFTSIALHNLLSRKLLTESEIIMMRRLIFFSQLTTNRLFAYKQLLLGSNKALNVLKDHMIFHLIDECRLFATFDITDTDFNESAHKEVHNKWDNSSKRLHNFQGKELLTMDRLFHIANLHKEVSTENNSILEESNLVQLDNTIFEFRLGHTILYSNIRNIKDINVLKRMDCNWSCDNYISMKNKLPIHPLIGIEHINELFTTVLRDNDRDNEFEWKDKVYQCMISKQYNNKWKIMLLNGARLLDENTLKPYIVYSKRDQIVKEAPGASSFKRTVDRFNVIEVRYTDIVNDLPIIKYIPARIMAIIRIYDSSGIQDDVIMFIISYFIHVPLKQNKLKQYPMDNVYKYHFVSGALWTDIVFPEQVSI